MSWSRLASNATAVGQHKPNAYHDRDRRGSGDEPDDASRPGDRIVEARRQRLAGCESRTLAEQRDPLHDIPVQGDNAGPQPAAPRDWPLHLARSVNRHPNGLISPGGHPHGTGRDQRQRLVTAPHGRRGQDLTVSHRDLAPV